MSKNVNYEKIEKAARTRTTVKNVIVYAFLTFWAIMVLFPFNANSTGFFFCFAL